MYSKFEKGQGPSKKEEHALRKAFQQNQIIYQRMKKQSKLNKSKKNRSSLSVLKYEKKTPKMNNYFNLEVPLKNNSRTKEVRNTGK